MSITTAVRPEKAGVRQPSQDFLSSGCPGKIILLMTSCDCHILCASRFLYAILLLITQLDRVLGISKCIFDIGVTCNLHLHARSLHSRSQLCKSLLI